MNNQGNNGEKKGKRKTANQGLSSAIGVAGGKKKTVSLQNAFK